MKKQFSAAWKGSRQPRKQRKYAFQAPRHIKQKMLSCHLSKELRERYKRRAFQLRKNDIVKVMNGEFKGKSGKASIIDLMKMRVAIEGLQISKKDGSKTNASFNASNLMITEINLDDKKRMESLKKDQVAEKAKTENNKNKSNEKKK